MGVSHPASDSKMIFSGYNYHPHPISESLSFPRKRASVALQHGEVLSTNHEKSWRHSGRYVPDGTCRFHQSLVALKGIGSVTRKENVTISLAV